MGGKMNLNPLKKDDNTDALVKALEDANTMSGNPVVQQQMPTTDSAAIAADPQVATAGVTPMSDPVMPSIDAASTPSDGMITQDSSPADLDTPSGMSNDDVVENAAAGIAFSGNDLPAGLSSDADAHLPEPQTATAGEGSGDNSELDTVKNSALEQLRPLIEKLDLEPADKFDKYLMMLRASDDPALIKPAFEAAQAIEGEKERAQALLDIINEINYITSSQQQS